jgi:hypothetical protein
MKRVFSRMRLLFGCDHAVVNGERTRLRVQWSAPRRPQMHLRSERNWVTHLRPIPTGGGAGRHTRGRVCSPFPIELLDLGLHA